MIPTCGAHEISPKVLVSLTRSMYLPLPIPRLTPLCLICSAVSGLSESCKVPTVLIPIFLPRSSEPNTPTTRCLRKSFQSKFSVNRAGTSASQTSTPRSRYPAEEGVLLEGPDQTWRVSDVDAGLSNMREEGMWNRDRGGIRGF